LVVVEHEGETRANAPLSLRAYATMRGDSPEAVSRAIKGGRLVKSVTYVDGVPKIADPALADQEWEDNTDRSRAPDAVKAKAAARAAGTPPSDEAAAADSAASGLAGASAREKHWRALTAELKYRQAAGELVSAAEVQAELTNVFTTCRTKLLGLPSKLKQRFPELSVEVLAGVDDVVREALEELAPPAQGAAA
jgi:hypothetical protein